MAIDAPSRSEGAGSAIPEWAKNPLIVVLLLIVVLGITGTILSERFGTTRNLANLFSQAAFLGIIGLGQTLPVLTRGIDLSIGSTIAICAVLTSGLIDNEAARMAPVVAMVLGLGIAIGFVNATLSHVTKVHPLIVTLGMASVLRGGMLLYSNTAPGGTPESFATFAMGRITTEDGALVIDIWSATGLSLAGCGVLILYVLVWLFLTRTNAGRNIYAVGGDPQAARLSGISEYRSLLIAYGFSGFCGALAGIYLVSQQGIGTPELAVKGYELASITPVVVGGVLLSGGVGSVWGTYLGVVLMATLANLLNFLDVSAFYQWIVQGLIVLFAVSVYINKRGRQ